MKFLALAITALLAGCVEQATQGDDGTTLSAARGAKIYTEHCAACHGTTGQGDGPLAEQLPAAPTDLTALSLAAGGTFPREAVMTQIYGYPGRFHRGLMPEFGPLLEGPMVAYIGPDGTETPTPRALLDLVTYLEGVQIDPAGE